ncbi:alpha-amylase family glycosyl hydrolase [Mucilaginibacter paludis]|uniref:Alpha amylase catalytic region n=1 Tax=Mucilaginibacter paludis DSM 18603 TaxID=714943 RepID=H1YA19_9SPHI|nr:alpha-amylase family glycosyl hydrolase [Mucilaginibacter paludis]EHQ25003.1 alpha amylase catalytic region [Mucilaginibacter paludis DSM 18603]
MDQHQPDSTYWPSEAVFYSIYPLGMLGAPEANDFASLPVNRLQQIENWIPHIKDLGCNALYLGPVFESDFHGYDTADYLTVDRRLGDNQALTDLSISLHQNGIRLVLDGVFNHVGRNFFAFKDLQVYGENSAYRDWFCGVDFSRQSSYGDDFYYDGWYDAYNLVKLNVKNAEVSNYLLGAVASWMDNFDIDGIRLDVAEIIDKGFLAQLAAFCRARKPNFWLMGEVIKGDYNEWANQDMLDSTTNYEVYKGIYSSHNDHNYFEIAWALDRQYGDDGLYRHLLLYNFVDNHDCTRIASILHQYNHLFPVYALLFTIPGIPSVYYGSEWAISGVKGEREDTALRPAVSFVPDLADCALYSYIRHLIRIRQLSIALRRGSYRQLFVNHEQLVFERRTDDELVIVAINSSEESASVECMTWCNEGTILQDQLDLSYKLVIANGNINITDIPASAARILKQIAD